MNYLLIGLTLVILYNVLKSIKDNIAHHDTFKRKGFGKFFWQETAFAKKENVFHKYFPMFYDAWHLSEALMEYEIALACTMLVPELGPQGVFWYSIAYYLIGSTIFNILYEYEDK